MRSELGAERTLDRLKIELEDLERRSLDRHLEPSDADRDSCFCSNDYLGLARHPSLVEAVRSAVGCLDRAASTGSRLLSGHVRQWDELEQEFADWVGAEASLYFGSGYLANVGLLTSILRQEDTVYSDAANHASLIDGMRLARCRKVVFPHLDLDFLEASLRRDADRNGDRLVVVESIYSMEGDIAPLGDLAALAERYGAGLIIDDAHGIGVRGRDGNGLVSESIRASGSLVATVHTCGKALAAAGAFVAGTETLKDFLINRARTFIFSTAPPPYMAAHVGTGIQLAAAAHEARERLESRSALLRSSLRRAGFNTAGSRSQIVPVVLGAAEEALAAGEALRSAGFAVRAVRPPAVPDGTSRLRLSVRADVSEESILGLVEGLTAWRAEGK